MKRLLEKYAKEFEGKKCYGITIDFKEIPDDIDFTNTETRFVHMIGNKERYHLEIMVPELGYGNRIEVEFPKIVKHILWLSQTMTLSEDILLEK